MSTKIKHIKIRAITRGILAGIITALIVIAAAASILWAQCQIRPLCPTDSGDILGIISAIFVIIAYPSFVTGAVYEQYIDRNSSQEPTD